MQCSCGAATETREQTKDKQVIAKYERCPKCGRCYVFWRKETGNYHETVVMRDVFESLQGSKKKRRRTRGKKPPLSGGR